MSDEASKHPKPKLKLSRPKETNEAATAEPSQAETPAADTPSKAFKLKKPESNPVESIKVTPGLSLAAKEPVKETKEPAEKAAKEWPPPPPVSSTPEPDQEQPVKTEASQAITPEVAPPPESPSEPKQPPPQKNLTLNPALKQGLSTVETPNKQSSHVVSIIIIVLLVLILLAAIAGVILVLGKGETPTQNEADTVDAIVETTELAPAAPMSSAQEAPPNATVVSEPETRVETEVPEEPETLEQAGLAAPPSFTEEVTSFLAEVHLGGMRTGTSPRVMLNDVTYMKGDIVEPNSQLTFIGIQDQNLFFRDTNGVLYKKSF